MTPATLPAVWANLDDEVYLSAGLKARAHGRLVSTEAFPVAVTPGARVEARPPGPARS